MLSSKRETPRKKWPGLSKIEILQIDGSISLARNAYNRNEVFIAEAPADVTGKSAWGPGYLAKETCHRVFNNRKCAICQLGRPPERLTAGVWGLPSKTKIYLLCLPGLN